MFRSTANIIYDPSTVYVVLLLPYHRKKVITLFFWTICSAAASRVFIICSSNIYGMWKKKRMYRTMTLPLTFWQISLTFVTQLCSICCRLMLDSSIHLSVSLAHTIYTTWIWNMDVDDSFFPHFPIKMQNNTVGGHVLIICLSFCLIRAERCTASAYFKFN